MYIENATKLINFIESKGKKVWNILDDSDQRMFFDVDFENGITANFVVNDKGRVSIDVYYESDVHIDTIKFTFRENHMNTYYERVCEFGELSRETIEQLNK